MDMGSSRAPDRAPRALMAKLVDLLGIRHVCHTLCPCRNDVELFLLALYFAVVSGRPNALPALLTALALHLLRGEARWQLLALYGGILAIAGGGAWWGSSGVLAYLPAVTTLLTAWVVPMVPSIAPEALPPTASTTPAHVVGVQEVFLLDEDDGEDQEKDKEGGGRGMWLRCYYPTTRPALAQAAHAVTLANDAGWGFNAAAGTFAVATLLLLVLLGSPTQGPSDVDTVVNVGVRAAWGWLALLVAGHGVGGVLGLWADHPCASTYLADRPSRAFAVARGLASFGKVSSVLFSHLLLMSVSAVEDAPVAVAVAAPASTQGDTKGSRARRDADTSAYDAREGASGGGGGLPVVVFCHGLGGTRHLYSQMCMTIASQGHFVAVPEFTDGTAAATALPDGTVRPYTGLPPDGESVTDDKSNAAKAFRRRQLETRMADISRALSFLDTLPDRVRQARRTQGKAAAAGEDDDDDDDEQWIAGARIRFTQDPDAVQPHESRRQACPSLFYASFEKGSPLAHDNITLVGHSFGGSTAVHLATSAAPGAAALRRQLAGRFRGAALLDPWLFPNDDADYPPHHGDDRAPLAAAGTGKSKQKAGATTVKDDEAIPPRLTTADPSASFLCLHGVWNWPANLASEGRFVASMPRSRVAHARHTSAGHHNYSDISFLAPPAMAAMGMVAWRDPVQVHREIAHVVCAFLAGTATGSSDNARGSSSGGNAGNGAALAAAAMRTYPSAFHLLVAPDTDTDIDTGTAPAAVPDLGLAGMPPPATREPTRKRK